MNFMNKAKQFFVSIIFIFILSICSVLNADAPLGDFAVRYKSSEDCSSLTNGKFTDFCWDTTLSTIFKCIPGSDDTCNSTEEWQKIQMNGASYPSAGIPVSTGTSWATSIINNSSNWNTAYSWGNHASAGYLTSETDPVYSAWDKDYDDLINKPTIPTSYTDGDAQDATGWIQLDESIYLSSGGNVGIGIALPTNKLHVVGDSYISGNVGINTPPTTIPLSINNPNFYSQGSGGTITSYSSELNTYIVHSFTSTGNSTFIAPTGVASIEVLVVGGGGGATGGQYGVNFGAGGAGGQVRTSSSYTITSGQNISVTVGIGGSGCSYGCTSNTGGSSIFGTLTALGGGGTVWLSRTGGSNGDYSGGTYTAGVNSGGGAGAGQHGSGKSGGNGVINTIRTGSNVYYGGGGGGADYGAGGAGGGGNASLCSPGNGTANTGGGGAGGCWGPAGGSGGSGIVVVRYAVPAGVQALSTNGSISINKTIAGASLDINGFKNDNSSFTLALNNSSGSRYLTAFDGGVFSIGSTSTVGRMNIQGFGSTTNINTQWTDSTGTAKVTILDNGLVGIGTTSPSRLLSVGDDGTYSAYFSRRVGIGTNSPRAHFEIYGDSLANVGSFLFDQPTAPSGSTNKGPHFFMKSAGIDRGWVGFFDSSSHGSGTQLNLKSAGDVGIAGGSVAAANQITLIGSTGNVGIGTSSPTEKLDVEGNIVATAYYGDGSNLTGVFTSINIDGGNSQAVTSSFTVDGGLSNSF